MQFLVKEVNRMMEENIRIRNYLKNLKKYDATADRKLNDMIQSNQFDIKAIDKFLQKYDGVRNSEFKVFENYWNKHIK